MAVRYSFLLILEYRQSRRLGSMCDLRYTCPLHLHTISCINVAAVPMGPSSLSQRPVPLPAGRQVLRNFI